MLAGPPVCSQRGCRGKRNDLSCGELGRQNEDPPPLRLAGPLCSESGPARGARGGLAVPVTGWGSLNFGVDL